jgi:large subunit ribosomal protein L33
VYHLKDTTKDVKSLKLTLEHKESGERLYLTSKNKRNTPDRLQLKKYSPKLRKHVIFTEVK